MTSLHLPQPRDSPSVLVQPSMSSDMLSGACVLVVDDAPANVVLLTRLLRSAGAETVHGVTDPREAVDRWLETRADVLLLDLQMPHLDGFEVMSALQAAMPDDEFLPVLVLTADTTATTRDRALGAGANDFLTKPFDRSEVLLRVRNLLETKRLYGAVQQHSARLAAELELRAEDDRRLQAENRAVTDRLDAVLAQRQMSMVFQPVVDLVGGDVVGLEALARFAPEPVRPPDVWFEEAGRVGRTVELELAAVSAALEHLDRLPAAAFLAVNVSPATVVSDGLARLLAAVPADRIVLELTEHTPVEDYDTLLARLGRLRSRGIRVAVDDTGAGYAGMRHLLQVRPEIIKLDLALTRGIESDPARRALATGLVAFAREIGAVVIAEGVETHEQLETLRSLAIGWGQGYHLGRPGPLPAGPGMTREGRRPSPCGGDERPGS